MSRALSLFLFLVTATTAATSPAPASDRRRVMIWLYDCSTATLQSLRNHTDSFTAISPSLYTVGRDSHGSPILSGEASSCVQSIKSTLPGIEVWPWITSPDGLKPADEDALMRDLFTNPSAFTARAKAEAHSLGLQGFNVDFEAPGEADNLNKTLWRDTLSWADEFAGGVDVPVTFDVMCTANVSAAVLCNNFAPWYNASATADMVADMQKSKVQRFVSMGTYGLNGPSLLNQMDWFHTQLPGKWGLGACPTCNPPGSETPEQLLLRFVTAHAYGVNEVDMFAFAAKYTSQWEAYWPYLRAFLRCGKEAETGHCWPQS